VFLIAHFHKAALLMFSDRLAEAVNRLDVRDAAAVLKFRADTRLALETFLRFTHRYWFHEVSHHEQAQHLSICVASTSKWTSSTPTCAKRCRT
jgi:hypothetical protein